MNDLKIFDLYLNVDGHSRASSEEMCQQYNKYLKLCYTSYPEVNFLVFPVKNQQTKLECIYPPSNNDKSESDILKIYQLLLQEKNSEAFEKMKHLERKLKINKLVNNEHKDL